jgi:hypothetical protein
MARLRGLRVPSLLAWSSVDCVRPGAGANFPGPLRAPHVHPGTFATCPAARHPGSGSDSECTDVRVCENLRRRARKAHLRSSCGRECTAAFSQPSSFLETARSVKRPCLGGWTLPKFMRGSKPEPEQPSAYRAAMRKAFPCGALGDPQSRSQRRIAKPGVKLRIVLRPSILLTAGMKPGGRLTGRISFELR